MADKWLVQYSVDTLQPCLHPYAILVYVQAPASRSVRESREELVARLREEHADQAARLESLKQVTSHSPSYHSLIIVPAPLSKDQRDKSAVFYIAHGKVKLHYPSGTVLVHAPSMHAPDIVPENKHCV